MSRIIDYFFEDEEKEELLPIYIRLSIIYTIGGIVIFLTITFL